MTDHEGRRMPHGGSNSGYTPPSWASAPEPHLPLRRATPERLQARKGAPHPLFITNVNGSEGIRPTTSPTAATPFYTPVNAGSFPMSHLEARHDDGHKKSFETVVPEREGYSGRNNSESQVDSGLGWDSESLKSPKRGKGVPNLKGSRSVSDNLRGLRERLSRQRAQDGFWSPESGTGEIPPLPNSEDVRTSFRSAITTDSSFMDSVNSTGRSSMATGYSSTSDFVKMHPGYPDTHDDDFGVEDAIGMYANGFGTPLRQSFETAAERRNSSPRPSSSPTPGRRLGHTHKRSQSAVYPDGRPSIDQLTSMQSGNLAVPKASSHIRSSSEIVRGRHLSEAPSQLSTDPNAVPRDRYGFKKISHYVTLNDFNVWEGTYNEHIDRRRVKWDALLKQYGLSTDNPTRFPPKTDKVKRYVRKGIPPEWRGAAWFWYAGGPNLQKTHEGVYFNLLRDIREKDVLKDTDREHIERDLNRTFPDNIQFKPDPPPQATSPDGQMSDSASDMTQDETPIVRSLRRVLQAFAVHNPNIGYCQSLNFIAGLLLLFLNSDEERTFILLNIVTSDYLPGTHGVSLEGANIDIAVLMISIKDSLPSVWAKLDDSKSSITSGGTGLPTVSLATTAWFMSLFVGTLPIECVLRVWDCLFLEGSKTLFRIALAIFKAGEPKIRAVNDPMEIFQVVQSMPRGMLDANALMELCFKKRGGFGGLSQDTVERRREERRVETRNPKRSETGMTVDSKASKKSVGGAIKGRFRSKTKGAAG